MTSIYQRISYCQSYPNDIDTKTICHLAHEYSSMSNSRIKRLTNIGIALSSEKDINKLLNLIIDATKSLANADAGTLYLLAENEKELIFCIMHNDTNNTHAVHRSQIHLAPVPLYTSDGKPNHANVSSHAALTGENINIEDVYATRNFDFSGPRKYDSITGYRSQSMLVIPMKDHHGDVLGVVQLINAKNIETGEVQKFSKEHTELVASLASQAAVALNNARLIQNLEDLLQAFIKSIASAIDAKSKYTGNHIRRVVKLTMAIAQAVNKETSPSLESVVFDTNELKELSLAAWLHDVGKIVTPQHVIDKHFKLETVFDRSELIRTRFQLIESQMLQKITENNLMAAKQGICAEKIARMNETIQEDIEHVHDDLALILQCNQSVEFMPDEKIVRIQAIGQKKYTWQGKEYPYLTDNEIENLSIQKGNLTPGEWTIIKDHARATQTMLSQLPFPKNLAHVADYAAEHHEKLDGSGYVKGLKKGELSIQSRILAIADIFEALTASDRPYKKPMLISKALQIMGFMKADGHLDPDILDLFIEKKVFMDYVRAEVDPSQIDID